MGRLNKAKWCLLGCLIAVLTLAAVSVFVPDTLTNTVKWLASSELAGKLRAPSEQEPDQEPTLIEMVVETVEVSKDDYLSVVILKEKRGELYLPIWIGPAEANAMLVILEGAEVPRPLTHDLLCSIIVRMGASVDYIVINDLQNFTFFANIIINAGWTQMRIDARPSDAIAVALRVRAPIYVKKAVLDKAGVQPAQERDKHTIMYLER